MVEVEEAIIMEQHTMEELTMVAMEVVGEAVEVMVEVVIRFLPRD